VQELEDEATLLAGEVLGWLEEAEED